MKEFKTSCPVTKVAQLLSDTWTMLVAEELLEGKKRFCELERALPDISTRTLTLKLRKLEQEGLARKREDGFYEATKKGRGLRIIERAMRRYGETYL
ncbi:MAG: helix-turn-helix transcriptional regulator [Patescibacteria group bacterium]|nr:helix-turn-helix transcriptional regulator [Patescibacteria group bacterium]MDE1965665.1 helix-turn-helix transcriptional regulator [Patescibacteria group bacterium]